MLSLMKNDAFYSTTLKSLQIVNVITLSFLSGIAFCLYAWIIPLLLLTSRSPRSTIKQFNFMIQKGLDYLLPCSRILFISLATTTYLTSQSPVPEVAAKWHYWAAAVVILVPIAPYEVLTIFPINGRVAEIGERMEKERSDRSAKGETEELERLLKKWQKRHIGRILIPFTASLIGIWSITF